MSKEQNIPLLATRSGITQDTIREREDLQRSLLKHSNSLIDQLIKNLDVANKLIQRKLSPSHLERQINYLRSDIEPLRGFISRISLHAQNLGAMKKEYELQGAFTAGLNNLHTSLSSTCTDSRVSLHKSKPVHKTQSPDINISSAKPHQKSSPAFRSPRFFTPRRLPDQQLSTGVNRSCSPIKFSEVDGDIRVLRNNNCLDQVDYNHITPDNVDLTQIVDIARRTISCKTSKFYRKLLRRAVYWKYRLTGSTDMGIIDCFVAIIIMLLLYQIAFLVVNRFWLLYKSTAGVRRGIRPM